MTIRHFRVAGEQGDPEKFKDHVYETVSRGHHATLQIAATVELDEVSKMRGDNENYKFNFIITEVHTGSDGFFVGVRDSETQKWSLIQTSKDEVYFAVVD